MSFFKNLNTPNKLTILRILLVPVFIVFLFIGQNNFLFKILALLVFCIASATDALDGYIARSRNLITNFGKFMDPLADKLLVCSALICFVQIGSIPAWVVIIIIAREFIISGFRLIASDKGVVIAANKWGKAKTVSQMITIILLIIDIPQLKTVTGIMIVVMTVLTVVSLIEYIAKNIDVLKD
ncbi:MAG: CDP-diacylglycerol--glycerol-3-phosphate 3-phosphatidyltransferase [Lachnospiraceae bacterium]|nr:CDP-diacylglycerol--glycerol-3-phosphate 3-phosphatidyltransferase [Lachnospiraceae bacterium]